MTLNEVQYTSHILETRFLHYIRKQKLANFKGLAPGKMTVDFYRKFHFPCSFPFSVTIPRLIARNCKARGRTHSANEVFLRFSSDRSRRCVIIIVFGKRNCEQCEQRRGDHDFARAIACACSLLLHCFALMHLLRDAG